MDNPKVIVKKNKKYGKGLFAKSPIRKDEVITEFNGKVYKAVKASLLPDNPPSRIRSHAIQFAENKWVDTKESLSHYINHSCNPNCGIKDKFKIIAMRKIKKGEEITYDYEMSEDSDWKMQCRCGQKNCREVIGALRNMPREVRKKYRGYISEWLIKKYHL